MKRSTFAFGVSDGAFYEVMVPQDPRAIFLPFLAKNVSRWSQTSTGCFSSELALHS